MKKQKHNVKTKIILRYLTFVSLVDCIYMDHTGTGYRLETLSSLLDSLFGNNMIHVRTYQTLLRMSLQPL